MGTPFDGGQPENACIALEGVNSPEQSREMPVIGRRLLQIHQGLFSEIERLPAIVCV